MYCLNGTNCSGRHFWLYQMIESCVYTIKIKCVWHHCCFSFLHPSICGTFFYGLIRVSYNLWDLTSGNEHIQPLLKNVIKVKRIKCCNIDKNKKLNTNRIRDNIKGKHNRLLRWDVIAYLDVITLEPWVWDNKINLFTLWALRSVKTA